MLQNKIRLAVSKTGSRLFRNNAGVATYPNGSRVRYGLCAGSADLIGWTNTGRFLAIEVKLPGQQATAEQARFLDAVTIAGGVAGVARSVEDAIRLVS